MAFLLTSPEDSWFRSFGTKTVNYGGNLSHRFVNRVRSTNGTTKEKELPRHHDDEADIGESTSPNGRFEPAAALHGCNFFFIFFFMQDETHTFFIYRSRKSR